MRQVEVQILIKQSSCDRLERVLYVYLQEFVCRHGRTLHAVMMLMTAHGLSIITKTKTCPFLLVTQKDSSHLIVKKNSFPSEGDKERFFRIT